ncbi:PAS domain S-box protein [Pelagibius sp. CAU 1746]|uniref:PAS domain S-box protein n=1 Tax=Pelagibius sp. CAU 1746 TaxID=3140370 RepID=UPI00325BCF58
MGKPIRVLLVEDSADDADLQIWELKRGGYDPQCRRVSSAEAFAEALDSQPWEVILCDYTMPTFNGLVALAMLRERGLDIPFIFVSGTLTEEMAVEGMRAGAQDYIVKDRLKRLVPAIERELREAEARREQARDRAERAMAERRFQEILAMAPDAIIATDGQWRITVYNRAAEALFGHGPQEMLGKSLDLLLPAPYVIARHCRPKHPEGKSSPPPKVGDHIEISARRKNGEEFPVEAAVSRLEEDGKTTFMVVIRDISERKRSEETLRKLSHAVDHSANLIVMTDAEGVIEYANTSLLQRMGFSAGEVIGQRPSLWKSGKLSDEAAARLWQTIRAGRDWHGEFQNRCKDGSLISVSTTIAPIRNDEGRITHFISIQEDITQRKALEAQLHHAQRIEAVGQLTGGLAHDFNNLLTVAIGNLDLLIESLGEEGREAELAQQALDASLRGAGLTRQLLAFSRRQPLEPKAFDVNLRLRDTIGLLRRTLGEGLTIETRFAEDLRAAYADPAQFESAFANLAINARDAMPDGGTLTIETANKSLDADYAARNVEVAPGDYVMLAVSDNGSGIAESNLDKVFEPFFTTKEQGKGTGLGLSMIYGYAKQSGGHVKIYSELGHGTTVRLYLPSAGRKEVGAAAPRAPDVESVRFDAKVLVVEDSAQVRKVAVDNLRSFGFEVVEAGDGPAALKLLAGDDGIDLLFTDVVMPGGMSGPVLAEKARLLRPGLKVLFTSGYAEAALENGHGSALAGILLSKPYRKKDLARKLREVFRFEEDGS